jgi:uncharacterized protein
MMPRPGDFAPHVDLARIALPHMPLGDPAHDWTHLQRVWRNAFSIVEADGLGVDHRALAAAVLLHDCVDVPKDDPRRAQASRLSAARAAVIMRGHLGPESLAVMRGAIEAHSFSAGLPLRTTEDAVLRDADRLDTLGAVGIARLFATSGRMRRQLYDPIDPGAERRPLDDVAYTLDHFEAKLLRLRGDFVTAHGRALAEERSRVTERFLASFEAEIGYIRDWSRTDEPGDCPPPGP